jgi:hypothetical protein
MRGIAVMTLGLIVGLILLFIFAVIYITFHSDPSSIFMRILKGIGDMIASVFGFSMH